MMHIDPLHDIPAIHTEHIILTFVSSAIETVLNSNFATTSEPLSTQPNLDDDHNLLYLTPRPANLTNYGTGMDSEQLPNLLEQIDTTTSLVDDQCNHPYPKPSPLSLTNQPEHEVYLSTTSWPSDHQRSYLHWKLPTHSRHVQASDETWSGGSRMNVDEYSDESYGYPRSKSTNYDEILTQYPTDIATLTDSPSTPSINDLPTQVDNQATLFLESLMQFNEDDNYNLRCPTPPSSTLVECPGYEPNYDHESTMLQDTNDIYYSMTHWPSNRLTLPYSKIPQLPPLGGMAYEQHDTYHKVNCRNHHRSLDDNMYTSLQPTMHMPKPTYPTIFKPTFNSDQNGPDSVPSNIDMKFDYTTPPPNIGYATCQFKPSALDNGGILFNINSLDANLFNHNDELVPGTSLAVPILNDWDTYTSDTDNKTAPLCSRPH
jgi:hypothetical protein